MSLAFGTDLNTESEDSLVDVAGGAWAPSGTVREDAESEHSGYSDEGSKDSESSEGDIACCGQRTPGMKELRRLINLSGPLLINYMATNAMTLTDQSIVGHLTTEAFAAINLANAVMFGSLVLSTGIMNALCTLASQAFGAKRYSMVGIWLQVALVWTTIVLVVPTGILWYFTGDLIKLISPDEESGVYESATLFARWSIWWLIPGTVFNAVSVWMEAVEVVVPQTVIAVLFVGVNYGLNYFLVFGLGPFPGYGLMGSPLATGIAKVLELSALLFWCRGDPKLAACWHGWSKACLKWPFVKEFFAMGIPIMLTEVLYDWVFELLTFVAAAIVAGDTALIAVTGLLVNLLFFLTPFLLCIYIAVSVRVGTLLGDMDVVGAKRTVRIACLLTVVVAVVVSGAFYYLRNYIAYLYTDDAEIIAKTASFVPIVAIDFCISSISYVLQGVLEGAGKPAYATGAAIAGNWVVGVSLLFVLSHFMGEDAMLSTEERYKAKLSGLWWGVVIGEAAKMLMLGVMVLNINWEQVAREAVERAEMEEEEEEEDIARLERYMSDTMDPEKRPLLLN